jgi:hypothetical protein
MKLWQSMRIQTMRQDDDVMVAVAGIDTDLSVGALHELAPFSKYHDGKELKAAAKDKVFDKAVKQYLEDHPDYKHQAQDMINGLKILGSLADLEVYAIDKGKDDYAYISFWVYLMGHFTVTRHFDDGFYYAMIKEDRQVLIPLSPRAITEVNGVLIRDPQQLQIEIQQRYLQGFKLYAIGMVRREVFQILNQLSYSPDGKVSLNNQQRPF